MPFHITPQTTAERDVGTLARLSLRITVFPVLVLLGTAVIVAYVMWPQSAELLTFVAAVVAGLAAIYAAFYAADSLRKNLRQQVLQNSFDLLMKIHDIDIQRIRSAIDDFPDKEVSAAEFYNRVDADADLHLAVRTLLNYFETVAISIQRYHSDETSMFLSLGNLVPWVTDRFAPYIKEIRRRRNDERIYDQVMKLANAWNGGRYLMTQEALPDE